MIVSAAQYARAKQTLREDEAYLEALRADLRKAKVSRAECQRVMGPALSFHEFLRERVEAYERGLRVEAAPVRLSSASVVVTEIRAGLRRVMSGDEARVASWLAEPQPMCEGATPQELIDAGEADLVMRVVRQMLARSRG